MKRFTITILLLIFSQNVLSADRVLVNDKKTGTQYLIDEGAQCQDEYTVKVKAKSADFFDNYAQEIEKLPRVIPLILTWECNSLNVVNFNGLVDDVLIFRASANKVQGEWQLQSEPAPLETIALFMSVREPSFENLAEIASLSQSYKSVRGILSTYQFFSLEQQIHRHLNILDDGLYEFEDYLYNSTNFNDFAELTKSHESLLALINDYVPEVYPEYKLTYDDTRATLEENFWYEKIYALLDEELTVKEILENAKSFTRQDESFRQYADETLSIWFKKTRDFFTTQLKEAPLSDVRWAFDFLAGYPDSYEFGLPLTERELQTHTKTEIEALRNRLSSLQKSAENEITNSGTSYKNITEILETGFILAARFENEGFVDIGESVLAHTVDHINKILQNDLSNFKSELSQLELSAEEGERLLQQRTYFEELSEDFPILVQYRQEIDNLVASQENSNCSTILLKAGAWDSDLEKSIIYNNGDTTESLPAFACKLQQDGYLIIEVNWKFWFPKKYELVIEDSAGVSSYFNLTGDSFFFPKNLVVKNNTFTSNGKQTAISNILIPPPSGVADLNGVRDCDRLAADPFDPKKRADGVDFSSDEFGSNEDDLIKFDRAIDACIAALENDPDDVTQLYQMARLFWYSAEWDLAQKYIKISSEKNYAAAKYLHAQFLLTISNDRNALVDALDLLKIAGQNGYKPAVQLEKELNPEGLTFYRQIPPPGPRELVKALSGDNVEFSVGGLLDASYVLDKVRIKECFQIGDSEFSCEYEKEYRCKYDTARLSPFVDYWTGLISAATQSSCNEGNEYPFFDRFKKVASGSWEKL